jgi:hypothetical protein
MWLCKPGQHSWFFRQIFVGLPKETLAYVIAMWWFLVMFYPPITQQYYFGTRADKNYNVSLNFSDMEMDCLWVCENLVTCASDKMNHCLQ